jgi:hypothetical protein
MAPTHLDARGGAQLVLALAPRSVCAQADNFVNVIEVHGLLGANLSSECLSSAHRTLIQWKAPMSGEGAQGRLSNAHAESADAMGADGYGALSPAMRRRRRSSVDAHSLPPNHPSTRDSNSREPGIQKVDSHAQLRLDLLNYEWSESAERMHAQIAQLREALGTMPPTRGGERDNLLNELEAIPGQLEKLSVLIVPTDGSVAQLEDATQGWEQYRTLSLKLSRLANRIEELAVAAPAQISGANAAAGAKPTAKKAPRDSKGGK